MLFLGPDRRHERDGRELYGMDVCPDLPEKERYPEQQLAGSAYWIPEPLFGSLLNAILKQLRRAGFRIVVGHGHGPSTTYFRSHAAEWKQTLGLECFICLGSDVDKDGLGIQVDHAAMNETSLVMAMRPDLVQMERLPRDPYQYPVAVWGRDPRVYASADVGRKAISLQTERMSKILRDALERAT